MQDRLGLDSSGQASWAAGRAIREGKGTGVCLMDDKQ